MRKRNPVFSNRFSPRKIKAKGRAWVFRLFTESSSKAADTLLRKANLGRVPHFASTCRALKNQASIRKPTGILYNPSEDQKRFCLWKMKNQYANWSATH